MRDLEHLLIIRTRGVLQRRAPPIIEGPSSGHGEPMDGGFSESIRDLVPPRKIRGHVGEPVGIETICEEWVPIQNKMKPLYPYETTLGIHMTRRTQQEDQKHR